MVRFEINETTEDCVSISLDQVNARFVDETMRGTYEYSQINLIVARLFKEKDPQTGEET
jgi:hypothetical protein